MLRINVQDQWATNFIFKNIIFLTFLTTIIAHDIIVVNMEKEKSLDKEPIVYVIQEIAGTKIGKPKINIVGATRYGKIKFLLEENSQIIFSPGPIYIKLRRLLKDFKPHDYLLLTGDPAIILLTGIIVAEITHGKFNLLKWDKQEAKYYPIEFDLHST
jgi:hypothetical protein